ncbi:MAG: hypothetical protein SF029_19680 [bacterium]|nr:hypothetical protein [bacterium]
MIHFNSQGTRAAVVAVLVALVICAGLVVVFALQATNAPATPSLAAADSGHFRLIQDTDPETEVAVLPDALERLSWGAILAGTMIALVVQLALNMLAIAVGATTINPQYGEDSASPKTLAMGGALWVGASSLLALFLGGWVAARFAGIPNNVDGVLHGLTTWAVVTVITTFLLTSVIGRIISGTSRLIGHGLDIAERATEVAARGAVGAATVAAKGAANVAQGTANVMQNAASTAAQAARSTASNAADVAEDAVNRSPEMRQAMQRVDLSRETIMREARTMMEQAGMRPNDLQQQANAAVQDVRGAVQQAAQEARQSPQQALETLANALDKVFYRAQNAADQVSNDVDRQAVIDVLKARTNMSDEQARQTLQRWEGNFNQARGEADQMRNQLMQTAREIPQQARQTVNEIRDDVMQRVEQVRDDAEQTLRSAAQATTDAIARLAGAAFAAIVLGAIAAGLGGLLGVPQELPVADVPTEADDTTGSLHLNQAIVYLPEGLSLSDGR